MLFRSKLVLVHDFLETRCKLFGKKGSCSFAEFMSDKMRGGYQQLSLDMLVDWFTEHDDCFLVTDSKDVDVVELCCYILNRAPILKERLIVQIFSFAEYQKIKNLGISKIIFATYKTSANNSEIINFLKKNPCYAVSMSLARAEEGFALEIKDKIDVWILAFTLNKFDLVTHYKKLGVDGFFTDKILPS